VREGRTRRTRKKKRSASWATVRVRVRVSETGEAIERGSWRPQTPGAAAGEDGFPPASNRTPEAAVEGRL